MDRYIFKQLYNWKCSPRRKPLILNGARQVGKTYALKYFGDKHYTNCVYLNFEQDERLCKYFAGDLDPKKIIKILGLHSGEKIVPAATLIIFDEIQECPRALNSLKYFCEQANDYHIAAAGSLLGVKTINEKGFPVGKVNFLHLYPLSFSEFLRAVVQEQLDQYISDYQTFDPLPGPIHEKLVDLLKEYLYVGGMPEAVSIYIAKDDYRLVRDVQMEILASYERDFAKHAPREQIMKINAIWQQAPQQLAKENKKFIFSNIRKSARSRDYEDAIAWLVDAGLLLKSSCIITPKLPMKAYANHNIFKLFLLDIGLLGASARVSARSLIEGDALFTEFKGALTENYVAQELIASANIDLYYWTSTGTAEVDFIIQIENTILPLEVKAGVSSKKKSLLSYADKYQADILLRSTLMNLKHDGKIYNYPLYMVGKLSTLFPKQVDSPDSDEKSSIA